MIENRISPTAEKLKMLKRKGSNGQFSDEDESPISDPKTHAINAHEA